MRSHIGVNKRRSNKIINREYSFLMSNNNDLSRFINAQKGVYARALSEINSGHKRSHWMWYIFPQIAGLGMSEMSRLYAIKDAAEAAAYADHEILGTRLTEISRQLLKLNTNDAVSVFGSIDSMKLQSCMTLFSFVANADPIFQQVLDKFFNGEKDMKTIQLLNKQNGN